MTQPTLINLHPNEYTQRLSYYPFAVNLDRCMGSSNTLNDLFNRISNRRFFWYDNENKRVQNYKKHISCECKCKFDGSKCSSNQKWNYQKCLCNCKNPKHAKKILFRILLHAVVKILNIQQFLLTFQWLRVIKLMNAAYNVWTFVPTNVESTASINFHNKKSNNLKWIVIFYTWFHWLIVLLFWWHS